jgi:hypothetical protein
LLFDRIEDSLKLHLESLRVASEVVVNSVYRAQLKMHFIQRYPIAQTKEFR